MGDAERAVALKLDEPGEDAFLRLSRSLPALSDELAEVSMALGGLGDDLVAVPEASRVSPDASVDEVLDDLAVLRAKAADPTVAARLSAAEACLSLLKARRLGIPHPALEGPEEEAGIFLRLPPRLAARFPDKSGDDASPPHATLLYVGKVSPASFRSLVDAVRTVASDVRPFEVHLGDYGEFENPEGATIAHVVPRVEGGALESLHVRLREAAERALGRAVDHHPGPFKAHATLAYVPKGQRYEGPRPRGRWTAKAIEVWGGRGGVLGRVVVALGSGAVERHLPSYKAADGALSLAIPEAASSSARAALEGLSDRKAPKVPSGARALARRLARGGRGTVALLRRILRVGDAADGESADLVRALAGGATARAWASRILAALESRETPLGDRELTEKTTCGTASQDDPSGALLEAFYGKRAVEERRCRCGGKPCECPPWIPLPSEVSFRLAKRAPDEAEERSVLGIVLEPETRDAQNDVYSADEVRKSAWRFMERYQQFGLQHRTIVPQILPLESYLAPADLEIGGQKVKKGTWLLRVRVLDDDIWRAVKSGELTGFSIGGTASRRPEGSAA